ncbi:MAG TPA: 1-deoxy-D-xylulose-5-phosphate synthase [Oculatellaceae cyanobacterium]
MSIFQVDIISLSLTYRGAYGPRCESKVDATGLHLFGCGGGSAKERFPASMYTLAQPTTSFLEAISSPRELKRLTTQQLVSLAAEIREEIVANLSKTGGHLASNLGIVEITLALHKVFNSPEDQILWDVGHQCYVHKMLTGRRERFNSLRQFKGLSGFINPNESVHDAFVAGHSSTSISLAVGMAIARDHLKKDNKVIAVIGDGGLTGGMALEAINHLGHIQRNVLILLNDNEMSISENVGGFSQYMKRIKETFFYKDIKSKLDLIEDKLDSASITPAVWEMIVAVKKQAKERFDTPGIVFEKLGVNYTGPIDGHDVGAVISALESVKDKSTPQILHVISRKGKGFGPAENDAIKYHGVSAFSLEPSLKEKVEPVRDAKPKAKTYSDIFSQALIEVANIEPNMVAITPATAEGSGLVKFGDRWPDRFFDVAICEQHAVTMAAGMAKAGLKPVVSIYSTFLQRAMDQVIHDVAILNLPVVFGIDRGGLVEDGETHQGVFDIALMRTVPNLVVCAPKDAAELRNMVYSALQENKNPVAIRFPRDKAVDAENVGEFQHIDIRRWEVLDEGSLDGLKRVAASNSAAVSVDSAESTSPMRGVVILAYGAMVQTATQALPILAAKGVRPALINARSAKPLDANLLTSLLNNPELTIVTLEEGATAGGFGSAVMEFAVKLKCQQPKARMASVFTRGIPDQFIEHGARSILLEQVGLTPNQVVEFVLSLA